MNIDPYFAEDFQKEFHEIIDFFEKNKYLLLFASKSDTFVLKRELKLYQCAVNGVNVSLQIGNYRRAWKYFMFLKKLKKEFICQEDEIKRYINMCILTEGNNNEKMVK